MPGARAALAAGGGSDATPAFRNQCAIVVAAHLACFTALCQSGPEGSLLWAALTGLTIGAMHGIGHNFLHQKDNHWMWCCSKYSTQAIILGSLRNVF